MSSINHFSLFILTISCFNTYFILEFCKELSFEATHCMTESKLMIDALVTQLYIIITRIVRTETSFQTEHTASIGYPNKHKVVDFITTYINENYMNEISLEMFAKDFKKYYDFPPSAIKHTLHANRIKQKK